MVGSLSEPATYLYDFVFLGIDSFRRLVFNELCLRVYSFNISVWGPVGPITAYHSQGEVRTCLPIYIYVANMKFTELPSFIL